MLGALVFKAMPPPRKPRPTNSNIVARMAAELRRALVRDFSPDTWRQVIAAIDRGELYVVENLLVGREDSLPKEWADMFVRALGATYEAAANAELASVGTHARLELYAVRKAKKKSNRFPGVPHSDEFIRRNAASLVVRVSRDQRQSIRDTLMTRYNNKRRSETLVRDLKNVVGLDPARARALRNFEDKLVEGGARNVSAQVARYSEKLLQNRAETIARTESASIENQARFEAWDIAADAGDIPSDAEQEWVSSDDPCPKCQALDGQRVPLGEAFPSDEGPALPPLHPNCLCALVLRSF